MDFELGLLSDEWIVIDVSVVQVRFTRENQS
jgi:hypothetical protein